MTTPQPDTKNAPLDAGLCPPSTRNADCTLDRLTKALEPLLCSEGRDQAKSSGGAEVAALLRAYAADQESWRPYVTFREDTYSRNLIWRCGDYELLILGWSAGQESPIHDHAGQHCWMAVLDGDLEEVHFAELQAAEESTSADSATGRAFEEGRVKTYKSGGVAYIHDDIALHLIRPAGGAPAVSLHLYSSPIDACRIFCADTGTPSEVRVGYHTVRGADCDGADPDAIRRSWASPNA